MKIAPAVKEVAMSNMNYPAAELTGYLQEQKVLLSAPSPEQVFDSEVFDRETQTESVAQTRGAPRYSYARIKLSVIIPSYKDPLLIKTIDSLLTSSELGDQLEIIAVLDGYWPEFELIADPRVRYIHLGQNRGMRGAINAGVDASRGEFIMRTDEHCIFGKGFDRIMTESCQPNWIITARRYCLDPVKWEVMDIPYVDYEKLCIQTAKEVKKFTGMPWPERQEERKDIMIDETMAMQGSSWVMPRKWWNLVIGELQTEGYGPMYQDSHEMVFKTWKAGGKLMVNKNTWFAHKHVSFPRTHNYGNTDYYPNLKYAHDLWRPYYEEIKKLWKV